MTIFLVGSMGVGKSAIGRRLASALKLDFFDTDDLIVEDQAMSINEIFDNKGESYFRTLESSLIAEIDYTKSQIFATGGGLAITKGNLERMKNNGIVIFLYDNIESIASKLFRGRHKRPAIKDLNIVEINNKLREILNVRNPIYQKSHLTFKRSGDLDQDVDQLSTYIKKMLF